ncbi:cytochrome c1 [Zavarzinia sp. CC-PAN008]|uniref:cytochrome c1 n=1 Tax=Zavarzinia sp. CC-PAN008 TaxID=3243332 RepID=UPI003F7483AF
MRAFKNALASLGLVIGLASGLSSPALAAGEAAALPATSFAHDGVFGGWDRAALQRGLQVYKEVCSACHSMHLVNYRNLADLGYSEKEIAALAAQDTVPAMDDIGEPVTRPGVATDRFHMNGYANDAQARAANGGALPPDFSLLAKARVDGPTYIWALLAHGYSETVPEGITIPEGKYYNAYFPGHAISMAPPLVEDSVTYADGTKATVDQMAHDVASFLMWTAEPKLEARHQMGVKVMIFLVVLTVLLYLTKRKIWANVH